MMSSTDTLCTSDVRVWGGTSGATPAAASPRRTSPAPAVDAMRRETAAQAAALLCRKDQDLLLLNRRARRWWMARAVEAERRAAAAAATRDWAEQALERARLGTARMLSLAALRMLVVRVLSRVVRCGATFA